MKKILAFGDIIWDVYPDTAYIGGAALNFSAHCALCGVETHMISAVGTDDLGGKALEELKRFGVGVDRIQKNSYPTGQCMVSLDANGLPTYRVLKNVSYDFIRWDQSLADSLREDGFDALYFGSLIQRAPQARSSLRALMREVSFRHLVCDINLRQDCYDEDSVRFCLENATLLKISEEEEPLLRSFGLYSLEDSSREGIVRALCRAFPNLQTVLFSLGEDGALIWLAGEDRGIRKKGIPVKAVSTVGAGDSFLAAYLTAVLQGLFPEEAAERAIALSAFVVAHSDAVPAYRLEKGVPQDVSC